MCVILKDKVSVIVPIYNRENFLDKCLNTIINQTYKNLEIILVDDGSEDNSLEICKKYEQIDKRVKVIHKINGGLSSARNAGIEASTGDWISFIDSDDSINLNFYYVLLEVAYNEECDIVQCEMQSVHEQRTDAELLEYKTEIFGKQEALQIFYNGKYTVFKSSCNKIFRKELFKQIRYPVGKIFEDRWIANEIYYAANRIAYITSQMYYYTINESGIMHSKATKKNYDTCLLYLEHYKFFIDKEEGVLAALAIRQFYISLLNLRYTLKRYSTIYGTERESLLVLYKSNKAKLWKAQELPIIQKIILSGAWHNVWCYFIARDFLDVVMSIKKKIKRK